MVRAEAEGRALGAMEERSMCGGYRPRACEEEQERRLSSLGSAWRNRPNATGLIGGLPMLPLFLSGFSHEK